MWQEIITGIIVASVFFYVGYKLYNIIRHPEKSQCNCGCKDCPSAKGKHNSCCQPHLPNDRSKQ